MPLFMFLIPIGVIGFVMFLAASQSGLSIGLYFDAVSFFLVMIPTVCLTVASYSFGDLVNAFSHSFSDVKDLKLIKNSISLLDEMKNTCIMFAWIGLLIGWIIIFFSLNSLAEMDESKMLVRVGLALGVSLIPLFYGYFFSYLFFEPIKNQYIKKQNNLEN